MNGAARKNRRAWIATAIMLSSSALAYIATPRNLLADKLPLLKLDQLIPQEFGGWRIDLTGAALILDPETAKTLRSVYDQTLSRTYVNSNGQRIMLSMAYGKDQTDTGVALHYPEVCYPAQGFKVVSNEAGRLETSFGSIPVRRLETTFVNTRFEPVTYWTMIGLRASYGGLEKKLAELRHSIKGEIADGLLIRVSNITRDSHEGWELQRGFVESLLASLSAEQRARLAGVN